MKKLILLLLIIILPGCLTELKVIYPVELLFGIDFTPYTQKGFLITPEKYSDPYESIGIIDYTVMPGAVYELSGREINPYYKEGSQQTQPHTVEKYEWIIDTVSFDEVLNQVYTICIDMGADALVNFKNERIELPYAGIKNPITITGYRITGYAIKRKDQ